jgi:hypothetical protein
LIGQSPFSGNKQTSQAKPHALGISTSFSYHYTVFCIIEIETSPSYMNKDLTRMKYRKRFHWASGTSEAVIE